VQTELSGADSSGSPPPGPPWDLPVEQAPLAFVDLEMTGLDPSKDRVVEVCIERWIGDRKIDEAVSLVRPPSGVSGAAHVHGLDEAALAEAPPFEALAAGLSRLLDGSVLVAHAAAWDVRFLTAEMDRAHVQLSIPFYLDTLVLARRSFALQSYSLSSLALSLGIDRGQAHRAASDVRVMRQLFARCVRELSPVSVRDLWEVRIAERRAREAIVSACHAAVEHALPVVVTYRAARRAPEPLTMVLTAVRSDLDPPRVMGYQLPGRGRRELRADRILRLAPATLKDPLR
jgi:DNA polymerase III subunit epsilon